MPVFFFFFFFFFHGKTIDLEQETGLPEGQRIAVEVRPLDDPPAWLERFVVDPDVLPGKFVIAGTQLLVDDLVQLMAYSPPSPAAEPSGLASTTVYPSRSRNQHSQ